ncbi:MAG: flippase activity-associated protein Agl23 [Anaerolineae bacterium]
MAIKSETRPSVLDMPVLAVAAINWELVLYAAIFVAAIFTRFWQVGARVMSHDESLHALYSWNLYAGKGYQHDPLMHGPFLFHINAFFYFLFGDNDFTARISTALFGVVLVILPYWLRPWLGRIGALAASLMLLISPGILYYSRYIRHDIFITVWTVLMAIALFQYMRTRAARWLYVGAAAVALSLATKEVAFIHGFIGFSFIVYMVVWERLPARFRAFLRIGILAVIVGLIVGVIVLTGFEFAPPAEGEEAFDPKHLIELCLLSAGLLGGWLLTTANVDRLRRPVSATLARLALPDVARVGVYGGLLGLLVVVALAGVFLTLEALVALIRPASDPSRLLLKVWEAAPGLEIAIGLGLALAFGGLAYIARTAVLKRLERYWQPPIVRVIWGAIGLGAVIFVLLYTTFFSNPTGLGTGTYGAISYWLQQQDVQRGGQPWYYYLLLVPLYEFLPFFTGLIGGLVYLIRGAPSHAEPRAETRQKLAKDGSIAPGIWPSDGGTFANYLIYWSWASLLIYSWAGEKMPWLTVHITLPLILLSGHVVQSIASGFDWSRVWRREGVIFAVLIPLLGAALIALFGVRPFQGQSLNDLRQTLQFVAAAVVAVFIVVGLVRNGRRLSAGGPMRLVFIVLFTVLALLTVRFAWLFSFVNYDYVNEPLVYAHAAPDVKLALNEIDDISQRTVGDKQIKIAYSKGTEWPLEWYMRQYPNRVFFGDSPSREALDAPVLIIDPGQEDKVKPFLGNNYDRFRYRLVWWPVEDYKEQTFGKIWRDYISPRTPVQAFIEWRNPAQATPVEEIRAQKQVIRDNRRKLWNIIFYRKFDDYELNEWPFVHRFYLYVRKDVRNELWDYRSGPLTLADVPGDPFEGKRFELAAVAAWGSNGSGDGQFIAPRNLAVSPQGQVYVVDSGNHRVQVFDSEGNFLAKWGEQGTGPGQFSEPWGIAIAPNGNVYVADTWNNRIQVFDAGGNYLFEWGGPLTDTQGNIEAAPGLFYGPREVVIDEAGNVYVTDTGNKRIQKFSAEGQYLDSWGGPGIIPGRFEEPVGLALDGLGNFYVADTWNRRIQKFGPDFEPVAEWEVNGWTGESIFNKPYLAVDDRGRVFASDPEAYRVLAFTDEGELVGTWGQYGFDLAAFALPQGLATDDQGFLYVADADNNRVLKYSLERLGADLGEQ